MILSLISGELVFLGMMPGGVRGLGAAELLPLSCAERRDGEEGSSNGGGRGSTGGMRCGGRAGVLWCRAGVFCSTHSILFLPFAMQIGNQARGTLRRVLRASCRVQGLRIRKGTNIHT